MVASPVVKTLILFVVILTVIGTTFAFAIFHHEDGDDRIGFSLTNHLGEGVTESDLAGQHLLVFFGFTSCTNVCPTQMSKLTTVMTELDQTGHGRLVTPIFISVDPERDTAEAMSTYVSYFHEDFVGLTGSRTALASVAARFKTFLDKAPVDSKPGYQLTHSSIVYVVDPFSRLVDYVPFETSHADMAEKIRKII